MLKTGGVYLKNDKLWGLVKISSYGFGKFDYTLVSYERVQSKITGSYVCITRVDEISLDGYTHIHGHSSLEGINFFKRLEAVNFDVLRIASGSTLIYDIVS